MRKTILLALLFFAFNMSAQDVTLTPGNFDFVISGIEEDAKIGYELTNNSDDVLGWSWVIEKGEDFPAEWQLQVCDQILCWGLDTESMPTDGGLNQLAGGEATAPIFQYVRVVTNGVGGSGSVRLCVYNSFDYEMDPIICSQISTSTADFENLSNVNIFPNPAHDYFQITGGNNVAQIDIYDIVGKKVANYAHTKNASYDISEFRNGLYVVRLLDNKGSLVKSMRLSKR